VSKRWMSVALVAGIAACATMRVQASDWPVFGHDPQRSLVDAGDTILTEANVGKLRERWQINFGPGTTADSTPILIQHVKRDGVVRPMLFQTAKNGTTLGVDAITGKIYWQFLTKGPNNITTSTPAEDPSGTAIYVPGLDGYVHKLDAATGRELHAPGFPARITLDTSREKNASALNLANGYLYATTSGYYGDAPFYDGHVVAVRLSDGRTHVFNSLCSSYKHLPSSSVCSQSDSGIWGRGGAVVDPDSSMHGEVYAATGNGQFDANTGGDDYGDSILSLSEDVTTLQSHYTPADFDDLQNTDTDLGSTSPGLLPRQNASRTPLMLVQGGKDSIFRLLDRSRLPGVGHEMQEITLPNRLYASPAIWTDPSNRVWIYIGLPDELDSFRLVTDSQGHSRLVQEWQSNAGSTNGEGTSPVVSNGMVFVAFDNALFALDALTGHELWSSAQSSARRSIGPVHWESPIVVNGWVYCSDENGNLTAYSLPSEAARRRAPHNVRVPIQSHNV